MMPFVGVSIIQFRGAIAEMRCAAITDEGDGLAARRHPTDAPRPFAIENEGGPGLAGDFQARKKLRAPDPRGDVDPPLVTLAAGFQPAVADRRHRLPDGSRLQDYGRRQLQSDQ